jgi:prophage tail gpP-like protein
MPNPNEWCEVRAAGGVYRDWVNVAVSWGMARNVERYVRLQCAEPGKVGQLRLKPGDDIEVDLGGYSFIRGGKIRTRQAAIDANRHGVQIEGLSKAGEIVASSVDVRKLGSQFRGYPLEAIANAVLKPHGLKLRMDNAPSGAETPFDSVIVHYGETVFEFIDRLARQRDCFITVGADGNLRAGLPKGEGGGNAALIEGVNILSANATITDPAVTVAYTGQDSGRDDRFGSKVAQVAAEATIGGFGNKRLHLGLCEEPVTHRECQLRTNHETRHLLSQALQVQVTHQGWLKPSPGVGRGGLPGGNAALWNLGEHVTLKSPSIIPVGDGTIELRVWEVLWSQSEAGTLTTVTLVSDAVFSDPFPNAREGDGSFQQSATPAMLLAA